MFRCLAGKQHRVAFKSQPPHKKPEVLDLVHSDVRKMSVRSMDGANYFIHLLMTFRRRWVYVLKTKDQVLSVFKQFQILVERQTENKITVFALIMGGSILAHFMPIAMSGELG
jgi:hypothetical protein